MAACLVSPTTVGYHPTPLWRSHSNTGASATDSCRSYLGPVSNPVVQYVPMQVRPVTRCSPACVTGARSEIWLQIVDPVWNTSREGIPPYISTVTWARPSRWQSYCYLDVRRSSAQPLQTATFVSAAHEQVRANTISYEQVRAQQHDERAPALRSRVRR